MSKERRRKKERGKERKREEKKERERKRKKERETLKIDDSLGFPFKDTFFSPLQEANRIFPNIRFLKFF